VFGCDLKASVIGFGDLWRAFRSGMAGDLYPL